MHYATKGCAVDSEAFVSADFHLSPVIDIPVIDILTGCSSTDAVCGTLKIEPIGEAG